MQMDQTTQQNAALVEEASAASQAIVEQAQALNGMIARYNVGGEGAGQAGRESSAGAAPSAARRRVRGRIARHPPRVPRRPAAAPTRKVAGGDDAEWKELTGAVNEAESVDTSGAIAAASCRGVAARARGARARGARAGRCGRGDRPRGQRRLHRRPAPQHHRRTRGGHGVFGHAGSRRHLGHRQPVLRYAT